MIFQGTDANGNPQVLCLQGIGTPTDRSLTCDGASDMLLAPIPTGNPPRSGWIVQNKSTLGNLMFVNDLGSPADSVSPSNVILQPGESFPPPGYPVTQGEVQIFGTAGDNCMAREW